MRNLAVYEVSSKQLLANSEEHLIACYGHNDENPTGEVYLCSNLTVSNFDEDGAIKWKNDLSEVVSPNNTPVNVTFLTLNNALCIGLSNGELITISNAGSSSDLAGFCDNGLLAMEWSPDQELLVLVTKELNTILMSCTFDPINEENLLIEEFGEKQFITVGWGKKETQFHGSEGKHAAKVKNEVCADPNVADDIVKITWRGDGQLYAVGFTWDGIRRFKVFDREGQLQYTSEKQQGLESNLSWRPSGNVITTTQRYPDKYDVSFFEKNGLKHGGFTIPVNNNTQVEDLVWSVDSEILALQCFDPNENMQKVMLFTTSNYHWYLKQVLCFGVEQRISKLLWDNDFDISNNKKLHVILRNGEFYTYTWIWNIDHSTGNDNEDNSVVAVIDGNKLLLTGIRQTVVPPPMAALEIELDSFINSIHFAPLTQISNTIDTNSFFVCTSENTLVFYQLTSKFPLQYEMLKCISFQKYNFPFQNYNWQWINADTVFSVEVKSGTYNLLEYNVNSDQLILSHTQNLPLAVTRAHQHPTDPRKLFLQLSNGEIVEYNIGGSIVPQDVTFPFSCPKFSVILLDKENLQFLGLSYKGSLYINHSQIMNNVSSFFVHTHFLLLTTLKHLLLCAELSKDGLNAIKEYQKNETAHVYRRKIERGAKLIIAVPNATRTVFQLPRGNLEAIQPRPLSLKIIGEYLDDLKYYEAFDLMRAQRINLNLIYDHNPDSFLKHVDVFLESVKNNSWLSLFLSELENVDVTKTMYASSYADRVTIKKEDDSKIQRICDIVKTHLDNRSDRESKILPLLTTFVKKNHVTDLEQALCLIKKLKEQEADGSKLAIGSDEALKYLLYMVDVSKLFDVALGMYDFDLVLLVANKSQKDPKEYIPMLNELNEMEENYKRFTINKRLKRFDRAVDCLASCGPQKYAELRTFVKYHSLYKTALDLFNPKDEIYKQISDDFGLYLRLEKRFTEAGIIYRRAKSIDKAIECFKDALECELAIELACKWPKEKFETLCRELVDGLKEENRHKEALLILEKYSSTIENTIEYAIERGQYRVALRLCSKCNYDDLKNDRLLPALLKEYNDLQNMVESHWTTFIRHRNRLQVVRETKKRTPVEEYDLSYANKDSDLYSDAGSTIASSTSRSSSRTFRSSKNKRKHERKVASYKEGSQYEDVGLVIALHSLVKSAFDLRPQVREVNVALSCFGRDTETFILQKSLQKLLKEMKDSFKDIWTSELVLEATNAEVAARNVPEGCSVVPQGIASLDAHLRIAPVIQEVKWELNIFD